VISMVNCHAVTSSSMYGGFGEVTVLLFSRSLSDTFDVSSNKRVDHAN